METILTVIIVAAAIGWACWSSFRMLTAKKGACNCTGTCKKEKCIKLPENNDKS